MDFPIVRVEEWPINNENVREKTKQDEELQRKENIKTYYNRRHELTIHDGVLMWGYRVVVPRSLRKEILEELHSHQTKNLARSYVYWPNVDRHVKEICSSCIYCLENRPLPKNHLDAIEN
ncbi:hypothetical protein NQ315_002088 [Exocentrus adspersus]|uniref:RNA-directed DNA polymerase n=1 Tax=Exocentrus adspersus TaxID=1586481 RepID=A0AAV8V5V4_9CUCU|nr:hypothetical protein NQ315_002088 [Exocentrus adspersus]